jgi:hypothetical protein
MGRLLRYALLIPAWTLVVALGVAIAAAFLGWPLLADLALHGHGLLHTGHIPTARIVVVEVFWLPLGVVVLCLGDFHIGLAGLLKNTLLLPVWIVGVALVVAAAAACWRTSASKATSPPWVAWRRSCGCRWAFRSSPLTISRSSSAATCASGRGGHWGLCCFAGYGGLS